MNVLPAPDRTTTTFAATRSAPEAAATAAPSHREAPARAGEDDVELELAFEQAALGTTATVHIDTATPCSACTGTGAARGAGCTDCAGSGSHTRTSGGINIRTECRSCDGAGRSAPTRCEACHGRGGVTTGRAVTLRVPPGVSDGARLRFSVPTGTGHTQRHAVVRVAGHPYFTRDGNDLKVQLPITIAEAALGATVAVPTLGGAVTIRIPPGTHTGRTFRIPGRGIPAASGSGDLLATVDLSIPAELNDEQRRALEAFASVTLSPRQHLHRTVTAEPGDVDADCGALR